MPYQPGATLAEGRRAAGENREGYWPQDPRPWREPSMSSRSRTANGRLRSHAISRSTSSRQTMGPKSPQRVKNPAACRTNGQECAATQATTGASNKNETAQRSAPEAKSGRREGVIWKISNFPTVSGEMPAKPLEAGAAIQDDTPDVQPKAAAFVFRLSRTLCRRGLGVAVD